MNEEEELILKIASDIEIQLWIHQDLNNPKSEKFWLSKFVSKEPQFYEKLLQEFKDNRRYIVLSKLIEVYKLNKKKIILHDKLFRMDYKPVYEFLLKYQQDIQSIGEEKPAAITDSHEQIEVKKPAKRFTLGSKKKDEELNEKIYDWIEKYYLDGKGSKVIAFKNLALKSKTILKHELDITAIRGRYERLAKKKYPGKKDPSHN